MLIIYLTVFLLIVPVLSGTNSPKLLDFQQNDYNLTVNRYVLARWSKKHFQSASAVTFKYNRTITAFNLTFKPKVEFGNDLQVIVQAYKFLSNEYRYFPLRFQMNICDALSKNVGGMMDIFKCGNFTGCPIKKNVQYHICNFAVDQSKFPPLIPNGEYQMDLEGMFHGEDLGIFSTYLTISRQVPIQ